MEKCVKCKINERRVIVTEGGVNYPFCEDCAFLLESAPTNNTATFSDKNPENWVMKNIQDAKERRANGIFLWK
jgi:hypothetical protein